MTDTTPAGTPAPKRTPTAKTTAKTPVTRAPAAKVPTVKTPAATAPVAKAPPAKAPVAKAPAAKTPVAKAPIAKAPAAKVAATKAAVAAKTPPPATLAPVEPTPVTVVAPTALPAPVAAAPAGWYPVAAGSPQQRWWDGAQWTEHVYAPATAVAPPITVAQPVVVQPANAHPSVAQPGVPVRPALRAPAGTKPNTVWFWLLVIGAPVLSILELVPTSVYLTQIIRGATTDPTSVASNAFSPAYVLVLLSGWFIYAVCVVFALLDWRELRARDVPAPFHWAWSFFVILVGWPAVYVIGRTVVVKRRTGGGLAPLWVFIGLEVVTFVASLVVAISAFIAIATVIGNGLSGAGNL